MFIVLEGIDGCGKTYSAREIKKWLEDLGEKVLLTAEPTFNLETGKSIRKIMSDGVDIDPKTLTLLFVADRQEHLKKIVEPALKRGEIVLCERYYYSTIAYQSAQGEDKAWLKSLNENFMKPDIAIFIDIDPKTSMEKIQIKLNQKEKELEENIGKLEREKDELIEKRTNILEKIIKQGQDEKHILQLDEIFQKIRENQFNLKLERQKYSDFESFEKPKCFTQGNEYNLFLEKVRDGYLSFKDELKVVDSNRKIEFVIEDIQKIINEKKIQD